MFTIAGLHPESGGPARSVPALGEALGREGVEVEIVSLDYGGRFSQPLTPAEKVVRTTYVDCSSRLAHQMQWTPRFKSTLRERCRTVGSQIMHDTGVWLLTNHAAAAVSRELKLPRIVSPRGMLTAWSMQHKGWKKQLAWRLYQQRDLRRAQVLHATSPDEAEGFRALGLSQPIAIIPNGVELPSLGDGGWKMEDRRFDRRPLPSASSYLQSSPNTRTALFLSRIHRVKGLLDLVEAWAAVRPEGWRVVIAGDGETGHLEELKTEIRKQKVENVFEFAGPVTGEAKWEWYRNADLFLLPSHSENFGMVVAEALAWGVPVITTRGTPWESLVKQRCGWWTEIGSGPLAVALREAISLTDATRQEMGERGRQLVEREFSWPRIAAQMLSVYRWMLGQGARPDCIV
jgi:glycosyltransferase involved in cell wall biosynthesis